VPLHGPQLPEQARPKRHQESPGPHTSEGFLAMAQSLASRALALADPVALLTGVAAWKRRTRPGSLRRPLPRR